MNTYLLIVLVYFGLITLISFFTKKLASRSAVDFLVAGRNLGMIACSVVIASEWLGGMSTIGVSEKAFTTGTLKPILYNFSTALGMVIIGFTVARHYREKKVHTVSEMLEHLFGSGARQVSAIAFLFAYIVLAFVQLQTAASVISATFDTSWFTSIIISALVITLYTYFGGMHSIAIAGIIHVAVMFSGAGLAVFTGLSDIGWIEGLRHALIVQGSPQDMFNPFSGEISYAWSLILGGVLGGMAGQASIQPVFAARSPLTAKRAAIMSAFIIAPFGIMIALLGLLAKTGNYFDISTASSPLWDPNLQQINPKMVLPALLVSPEFIHPLAGGFALAGILAAILSTVGPVNFAVVTIATRDIYHALWKKDATDKQLIKTARLQIIFLNLLTIPLAFLASGAILTTAYISYGIRAIGAIIILLAIYRRGWINLLGVRLAFIGGTLAVLINVVLRSFNLINLEDTYVAVGSALVFIILGNLWKMK
jgi:SSS family solute:Na+ symporter